MIMLLPVGQVSHRENAARPADASGARASGTVQAQMETPMKKSMLLLTAFAAVVIMTSAMQAQPASKPASKPAGTKPADKPRSVLQGEFAMLVTEAKLTEDQKAKLEQRVKAGKETLDNWDKENGEKLKDAKAKAKEDAEAKKTVASLTVAREQINADMWKDINGMLTPEQKLKWDGFKLFRQETASLAKANLTDAQKQQMRELSDAAAKDMSALKDEKEIKTAKANLHSKIEALLTAEQKEATAKKAASQPASAPAKGGVKDPAKTTK